MSLISTIYLAIKCLRFRQLHANSYNNFHLETAKIVQTACSSIYSRDKNSKQTIVIQTEIVSVFMIIKTNQYPSHQKNYIHKKAIAVSVRNELFF